MNYKIVADSSCDLATDSLLVDRVVKIPLTLVISGEEIIDDENINQLDVLKKIAEAEDCPKSACPSPQIYCDSYEGEEECVFVVTLSSKLSGSYNSACLARDMYYEEHEDSNKKRIYVFDSESASVGETRIVEEIARLADEGMTYEEIIEKINIFIENQNTIFVLENIDTLRKNGRMSSIQALIASVLSIKPVLAGDRGSIIKLEQARGIEKALAKMIDQVELRAKDAEQKILAISECNCMDRALKVKEEIARRINFKKITISHMSGLSSLYANDGGIIVTF